MSTQDPNGGKWLSHRVDDVVAEVRLLRDRYHELANKITPVEEHGRVIGRLEERTENVNVTERDVRELRASMDKLQGRFDDVIRALYVGLIGFGASCACAGLFVFLAFR